MSQPLIFEVEVDARAATIQIEKPSVAVTPNDPRVIFAVSPGLRGERGLPGEGNPIFGEYLIGVKDGVNKTFETENPFRLKTTAVYLNGLREDSYTESVPNIIVLDDPPSDTDKLTIDYIVK
jgi:hypothetical protein